MGKKFNFKNSAVVQQANDTMVAAAEQAASQQTQEAPLAENQPTVDKETGEIKDAEQFVKDVIGDIPTAEQLEAAKRAGVQAQTMTIIKQSAAPLAENQSTVQTKREALRQDYYQNTRILFEGGVTKGMRVEIPKVLHSQLSLIKDHLDDGKTLFRMNLKELVEQAIKEFCDKYKDI